MSSNVETSNIETSNIETSNVETSNIETSNVETSNVETSNVETSNIETSNVETSNIETSNVETSTTQIGTLHPKIIVSRYELYPRDEPTCYCVGFTVSCPKGQKTMYRDTQVTLEEANNMSESNIVTTAYTAIKSDIDTWIETEMSKPCILGSEFIPTD